MTKEECELPSYHAALQFWKGEAYSPVVISYFQRSLLIGCGFLLARQDLKTSTQNALIASAMVETYVLYKTYKTLRHCKEST